MLRTAIVFLSALWVQHAYAAPFAYTVNDSDDTLYLVDLADGTSTAIGTGVGGGFTNIEALSFDPLTGALFALDDSTDNLLTIDIVSGIGTAIGDIGENVDEGGLAINAAGRIIFSDEDGDTYELDRATAASTFIGDSLIDTDNLTFVGATLYGVERNDDDLYTISLTDATPTLVGALGVSTSSQHGLAYDPGSGLLYLGEGSGDIYTVSPATGAATFVATGAFAFTSLAIAPAATAPVGAQPVPVLGGWGLGLLTVLLGLTPLYFRRRR